MAGIRTDDVKDLAARVLAGMGLFVDPIDLPIWGVEDIGAAINRSYAQTYYLIGQNRLPVTKVGKIYTTTLRRLRAVLDGPLSPDLPDRVSTSRADAESAAMVEAGA
jgi:hypothetical protein